MVVWGPAVKVADWEGAPPHQGAFQVEGLRVLAQQHDVLLQVVEAAVLVVADALLRGTREQPYRWAPPVPGDPGLGVSLLDKVTAQSRAPLCRLRSPDPLNTRAT